MTALSDGELLDLAGGPVADLETARTVEQVGPADAQNAEQAASAAEAKASELEAQAVLGKVPHVTATQARETARWARITARLTHLKAERHRQAQRIRDLHAIGEAGLAHAAKLRELRDATLADLATITELHDAIRKRIHEWNEGLSGLIAQGAALGPEKPRPGQVPHPSSGHVYAATASPVLICRATVLTPIDADHVDGPVAAIDVAQKVTREHDPAERLLIAPTGLIVPLGRDPGGHLLRRVDAGELRELSLDEKAAHYRGEAVSY